MKTRYLLVLNAGSSSLKSAVFELKNKQIKRQVLEASVSLQSNRSVLRYKNKKINFSSGYNLKNWWSYLHDVLVKYDIAYVGFRVVHGGEEFTSTTTIDNKFLKQIKKYNDLAPLHNPVALELIELVRATWPRVKMSASFDTAWFAGLKPSAYLYSLPLKYYSQHKIRKYGFHGLSHESANNFALAKLKKAANKSSIITCHLGSGSSIAWQEQGRLMDTTMGFSPNEGLTMSTRSGDLPPSIIFFMARQLKMSLDKIEELLDSQSGLLGLAGMSDLRDVLLASGHKVAGYKSSLKFTKEQKQKAKLALDIYIYDIRRYLASYIAMSKKLDAIVFTGGIGYNSAIIRKMILNKIQKPKKCKVLVIEEAEMLNIAKKTILCLNKK